MLSTCGSGHNLPELWQIFATLENMDSLNITDTPPVTSAHEPQPLEVLIGEVEALCRQGSYKAAVKTYKDWLKVSQSHDRFIAYFNLGVLQADLGDLKGSRTAYKACLKTYPDFSQAHINLGWVSEKLGHIQDAMHHWTVVVTSATADLGLQVTALNHMGRLQEGLKQYALAQAFLGQSLLRNPQQPDVLQHWLFLRMKQCDWPALQAAPGGSMHTTLRDASPLATLALQDNAALQWASAQTLVQRKYVQMAHGAAMAPVHHNTRIKLGYLSGDLCTHAVGLLLPEIIKAHNKKKFEVFAFDYSPEDGSLCRQNLQKGFEHWVSVKGMNDAQVAACIRSHQIDVLIDMHGLSAGARPWVMAQRVATLQGLYLGFMGTTSMPWVDFVVTDKHTWPEDGELFYSEQPLFVEPCVFPLSKPSRLRHSKGAAKITRKDMGLPARAYVLACFNHVYKINPQMWAIWMHLLKRNPNAVLWLLDDNEVATANLKQVGADQGIQDHQLVFAPRTAYSDYRNRLPLVDLYLDTYPYNAGSTARDVVECGVPMLTLSGRTMVSRMAGSLLHSVGLSELVARNAKEYRGKALALIKDRSNTRRLKKKLQRYLETQPPTAQRIVDSLEAQLKQKLTLLNTTT